MSTEISDGKPTSY